MCIGGRRGCPLETEIVFLGKKRGRIPRKQSEKGWHLLGYTCSGLQVGVTLWYVEAQSIAPSSHQLGIAHKGVAVRKGLIFTARWPLTSIQGGCGSGRLTSAIVNLRAWQGYQLPLRPYPTGPFGVKKWTGGLKVFIGGNVAWEYNWKIRM